MIFFSGNVMWEKTWLLIIFHRVAKNKSGHSLGRHYIFKSCDRWMNYKTLWPELIHFTASNPIRKDNFLFGFYCLYLSTLWYKLIHLLYILSFQIEDLKTSITLFFFIQSFICWPLIEPSFNFSMNFPLVF